MTIYLQRETHLPALFDAAWLVVKILCDAGIASYFRNMDFTKAAVDNRWNAFNMMIIILGLD